MNRYPVILQQVDIFYQLSTDQLEKVGTLCQEKIYQTGEVIFHEGSRSDELYIIATGEVDILVDPALVSNLPRGSFQHATIATLRRGQSFGEISLVDAGIRSATAQTSLNNTRLLVIPRQKLQALCESDPALGYLLMRNLAADLALKIRNTDLRIREELLYTSPSP